jgi:GDP-L-fucose synthase
MPTNLYGPGDNFDLQTSHVLPALMRRFHEAALSDLKSVTLWGSGTPKREFLHVDDLAQAVLFALEHTLPEHLYNVGSGTDLTIKDLALLIQKEVGHEGEIIWDASKPDGTPRKLMDVSKMNANGWKAQIGLPEGIGTTIDWFVSNISNNV